MNVYEDIVALREEIESSYYNGDIENIRKYIELMEERLKEECFLRRLFSRGEYRKAKEIFEETKRSYSL